MDVDPRRVLEDAATECTPCELLSQRGGTWFHGRFVRVEKAGVVVVVDEEAPASGEDVRVWFRFGDQPWTFAASVLRTGVPVPDRSKQGLMLGFIENWSAANPREEPAEGFSITVLPPNGKGLSLLGTEVRLLELGVDSLSFAVARQVALKFIEGGVVRVCLRREGEDDHLLHGEVRRNAATEEHYLYGLVFTEVSDRDRHPEVIQWFLDVLPQ